MGVLEAFERFSKRCEPCSGGGGHLLHLEELGRVMQVVV